MIILTALFSLFTVAEIASSLDVIIETDHKKIEFGHTSFDGESISKEFKCRNNYTWPYEIATFKLTDASHLDLFRSGNTVKIQGSRAVKIVTDGDLTIDTVLDVSGVAMGNTSRNMHLGGFVLNSTKCCYVGAGPGAAMTYHGGGHGGNGGGSWRDFNSGYLYGKSYQTAGNLIGGSTGALVYDSDPGTGGGAIKLQVGGQLTIGPNAKILANGYSVLNTSYPACAGGSAGGRIWIDSKKVILQGLLSAKGGDSGQTSNYSNYCGDGGGGGIIVIRALDIDRLPGSKISVEGGKGLEHGNDGKLNTHLSFAEGRVDIDTTPCVLTNEQFTLKGNLSQKSSHIRCQPVSYKVCLFEFTSSVEFSSGVIVNITGENALQFNSKNGNITVSTEIDVSGREHAQTQSGTFLGGYTSYHSSKGPGSDVNNGAHGSNNNSLSYGINPLALIGGSSCTNASLSAAVGGGAISFNAPNGDIVINATIKANGYTKNPDTGCGASGGTVILDAKKVLLNANVEVIGSDGAWKGGDGGVFASHGGRDNAKVTVAPGVGKRNSKISGHGKKGLILASVDYTSQGSSTCPTMSSVGPSSTFHGTSHGHPTPSLNAPASNSASRHVASSPSPTPSASRYQRPTSSVREKPKEPGVSSQLQPLVNATVTSESALNVSEDLVIALESMSRMTKDDTAVSLRILEQIANTSTYSSKDTRKARDVTRNMLTSCNRVAKLTFKNEQDNRSSAVVPKLTDILEQHGQAMKHVIKTNETLLVENDVIAFEVTKVDKNRPVERTFPVSKVLNSSNDSVTIPKEIFEGATDDVNVVMVIMKIDKTYNNSYTVKKKRIRVASNIAALSLSIEDKGKLVKPITLKQKLAILVPKDKEVRGGFWRKKSRKDHNDGWSYQGCMSKENGDYVETKCNHMTSFAVLMSVKEIEISDEHKTALSYITYIGCGVSLFGLLLTFATFVTLDNLDAERTAIHTNLVVALGIAQIIYLAGIGATYNKTACTCVAVMLHYFFTAAFSWMLAEGMHLYQKVVNVFSHGSKLKFYYVIGWGLPVIIVALAAGIRSDGYGTANACWISMSGGLIWAFVAPVLIVIIINFVVLIIVVKILMSSVSTVQVDMKTDNKSVLQIKAGAKAMVILMPILGLSWIFGLLAVNNQTLVFQYFFCIFNSLQGLFIFLIHCIGNAEVRSAFKRLHEKHTLSKSIGERSSAPKSASKDEMGEEILVRRRTNSSLGSSLPEDRTVTPKTLSAGQISLNSLHSLHCPTPNEGYYDDET